MARSAITTAPPGTTLHPRTARVRLVGPDVARAIALIGVVLMNYHGYLNTVDAFSSPGDGWVKRLFDPWTGPLSTRFAATFVLVAGVGVTLLTNRSRLSADRAAVSADRWKLLRRGLLLYAAGTVIDWVWSGTILPYYGAMFMLSALLFTLASRWLVVIGATAALGAAAVQWWGAVQLRDGRFPDWLFTPNTFVNRSPRGLLLDAFVNGTHPLLPWLAFLCAGMVLGRSIPRLRYLPVALIGIAVTAASYAIVHWVEPGEPDSPLRVAVLSTHPFDRALFYTLCTLGTSVAAFCLISAAAERISGSLPVRILQLAGQTSLSLYLGHIVFFNLVVGRFEWVRPTGLDTAVVLALGYWVLAITCAALWQYRFGIGPAEWFYRKFGG
jgi:uncharacterized membrane protein YeiB